MNYLLSRVVQMLVVLAGVSVLVSTTRGIDPRNFTIAAYGGGDPLHAAMVAEDAQMSGVSCHKKVQPTVTRDSMSGANLVVQT